MEAVRFTLSGRTAFFKKPEVNVYYCFTYSQIHKIALVGMFGAILGYGGYAQKNWQVVKKGQKIAVEYPEFYEKLHELKISIVPKNERGYVPKKVQIFNNSVGYANKDGNLIIKEQWLENPEWDIYVLIDCDEAEKLAGFLEQSRCIYYPYLGKNDHPADITNVSRVVVQEADISETAITSMFPKNIGSVLMPDEEDEIEIFKYTEKLPVALNGYTNLYEYEDFCYTNMTVSIENGNVYKQGNNILSFY